MKAATQRRAVLSWNKAEAKSDVRFSCPQSEKPPGGVFTQPRPIGATMSCNEKTALLAGQREQRQAAHIIVLPSKEAKDYEPIFTTADYSYGLSLEELLPFSWDPWWQKARRLCVACVWLTFVLTLLAALSLAYFHDTATTCRVLATTLLPPPATLALATNGSLQLSG